jgi:hypothetical protein
MGEEHPDDPLVGFPGDAPLGGIALSGKGGKKVGEAGGDEAELDEVVEGARRSGQGREPDDRPSGTGAR